MTKTCPKCARPLVRSERGVNIFDCHSCAGTFTEARVSPSGSVAAGLFSISSINVRFAERAGETDMASLSTRQSITLLAIIAGSLTRIDECRMFSVVAMKRLIQDTRKEVITIMNTWPGGQHNSKDEQWIDSRIVTWGGYLKDVKDYHTLPVFATICSRCLADLQTVVTNKSKLEKLTALEAPINKVLAFIDPNLENVPAFEKADVVMDELYKLIQWEWK